MSGRRKATEPEPVVVGLSWAAAELGIGMDRARSLARRGELPGAFKLGTLWRVCPAEFRRQVAAAAAARAPELPLDWGGRDAQRPPEAPEPAPAAIRRRGGARGSQGISGARIAAMRPRAEANRPAPPIEITGDAPSLVRRRRPSQ